MWVAVVPLSVLLLIAASVTVLAIGRPGGSRSANETRDTSASLTSEARDSETATEQTVDLDRPAGQTNTLSDPSWEELSRSVVLIDAQGVDCDWQGSGTIILDGSYVLTNEHVAGDANCDLFVWLTDSVSTAPKERFSAVPVAEDVDADLSLIRIVDENGNPFRPSGRRPLEFETSSPQLGDKIYILGYPSLGGSTITLTSGDFAGVELSEAVEFFKTTANMNPGVSGGAGLSARGKLVGIPTAGIGADVTCDAGSNCIANGSTIGLLRPIAYARELIRGLG